MKGEFIVTIEYKCLNALNVKKCFECSNCTLLGLIEYIHCILYCLLFEMDNQRMRCRESSHVYVSLEQTVDT